MATLHKHIEQSLSQTASQNKLAHRFSMPAFNGLGGDPDKKSDRNELITSPPTQTIAQYEDLTAALGCLKDFGFETERNLADLTQAQNIMKDLKQMLESYVHAGKKYREMHEYLMKLISDAGMAECVEDLLMVRKNSRAYIQ